MPKNLLVKAEELAIIKMYQSTKNSLILDKLIQSNQGYLRKFSSKMYGAFRESVPYEDILQTVTLGFIRGVQKFDVTSERRLLTYATFWMYAEAFDAFRYSLPVHIPVHMLRKMVWGTEKEYAEGVNETHKNIAKILQLQRSFDETVSEDVVMKASEFSTIIDTTSLSYEMHSISVDVEEVLNCLPETELKILRMRAGMEDNCGKYSYAEISAALEISKEEIEEKLKKTKRLLSKEPAILRLVA